MPLPPGPHQSLPGHPPICDGFSTRPGASLHPPGPPRRLPRVLLLWLRSSHRLCWAPSSAAASPRLSCSPPPARPRFPLRPGISLRPPRDLSHTPASPPAFPGSPPPIPGSSRLPAPALPCPASFPAPLPSPGLLFHLLSRHPSAPLLPAHPGPPFPVRCCDPVDPSLPCLPERSSPVFPRRGARPGLRGCRPLALGCAGQSRITWAQPHSWSPSGVVLDPGRLRAGGEWPGLALRDAQGPFPLRIAPALLRQASYGTIKIGIYQSLKRLFVDRMEGRCWGRAARAPPSSLASHSGHLPAPLPHSPGCVFCSFLALSFPPQDSHRNGAPLLGAVVFFVSESKDWIQS